LPAEPSHGAGGILPDGLASGGIMGISLTHKVAQAGVSVNEQIALKDADLRPQDAALRTWMANRVVPIFRAAGPLRRSSAPPP
jgi:hypothetical protein